MLQIDFKPTPKQYLAWEVLTDQTTTELGWGGGAGGGKSYLGCFWITAMCLAYPGTRWVLGRKELINLKRTTLNTLFKVFEASKLETGKHFGYNQQTNIISFTNGSQILLFDLAESPSDPLFTRLGSLELTGAFVDESNEVPFKAIDILKTRLGRQKNDIYSLKPKLLETFNPDKGHVYSRYYKPWKMQLLPLHRVFIQALATDNPYVPQDYIDQLRTADRTTQERLLYGNFEYDDDPTVLVDHDALTDLFTNTVDTGQKYLVADIARYGQDRTVIGLWEGLKCHRIDIWGQVGLDNTAERIKALSEEYRIPFSHVLIDEDGVGGGVVDMLKGVKGFHGGASPVDVGGKKQNFRNLRTQCGYVLADKINQHLVAITMANVTDQQGLIEELEQLRGKDWDKDGKMGLIPKDQIKSLLGRSPDIGDMLMMRMWFELRPVASQGPKTILPNYGSNTYSIRKPSYNPS